MIYRILVLYLLLLIYSDIKLNIITNQIKYNLWNSQSFIYFTKF